VIIFFKQTYLDILNYLNIIILLIVCFFGTGLPFGERASDVSDIVTSNIVNQIVYSYLFLTSIIILLQSKKKTIFLIKKEKFLSLFFLWTLLGIIWSSMPFSSFKIVFRLITINLSILSFLLYKDGYSKILLYIKIFTYTFIILNLVSVLIIPEARDPQFLSWRGLTGHKNQLGQVSLIFFLFCIIFWNSSDTAKDRKIAILFALLSIVLLVGTKSSTSLIGLFVVFLFLSLELLNIIFNRLNIKNFISTITIIVFVSVFYILVFFNTLNINIITDVFGKDSTLTGRTELWDVVLNNASTHFLTGGGLGAFWVPANLEMIGLYDEFVWLPNEAHNGYVDLLNDSGLIGLLLFLLVLINYFYYCSKLGNSKYWIILMIVIMILNLTETTFIVPGSPVTFSFIFAYWFILYKYLAKGTFLSKYF